MKVLYKYCIVVIMIWPSFWIGIGGIWASFVEGILLIAICVSVAGCVLVTLVKLMLVE